MVPRDRFPGSDKDYEAQLPGQFMEKWNNEFQTRNQVRFIDELNTPGSKLPEYLNIQHCEMVWYLGVRADSLYQIWTQDYIS